MNVMEKKLTEAINAKNNDVKSYIWKFGRNSDGTQDSIRMYDATPEQLQQFYDQCMSMLYSTDKRDPGRYVVLDIIKEQREKCNVELYLRKLKDGSLTGGDGYPRHLYCQDILSCIKQNKALFPQSELKNISISMITGGIPREFERLSISSVIDGCLDRLGTINNKHITFNFILKLGIYLTPEEMQEFTEKDAEGHMRSRLEVVKERLGLKPTVHLIVKPSGLNYTELRAMLNLRSKKYSELTTDQLVTLRNKVLFCLEQEVNYHIEQWESRIEQIKKVCEAKGIELSL
jgi:hypothetical protein